jgi:N-acetylglucosaminyldiphosphoundecaprenol N-acetyl-beta-D-mannosaminyltransferase
MSSQFNLIAFDQYSVFTGSLEDINLDSRLVINTINQYSYCLADKDERFKEALQKADILLPDGVGVVLAVKLLSRVNVRKIAGATLHNYLLNKLNLAGAKCFYLGSSDNTLSKIKKRIETEYPSINAMFYSPPFKPEFNDEDNEKMIALINSFKPHVLFIGMTAPKQEKWALEFGEKLNANVICSIGAVFDFYASTIKRPNKFWINLGLEWFIRLIKEPKRMSKRYLYYGPVFLYKILRKKIS